MAGWHHRLHGRGFELTPGVGDGQGSLVCCNLWGRKESDTTEWLNWTDTHTHTKIYCTLNCATYCYRCLVTKSCLTFGDPMDCSPTGSSLSLGFPRQEYWSGLPFPSPGNLTNTGIEPIHDSWVSCIGRQILYHWANYSLSSYSKNMPSKPYAIALVKHSNPTLW